MKEEIKTIILSDIRITEKQVYAYRGSLEHIEHKDVRFKGWCTFYHNLAVRSFSAEGVD